MSPASPDPTASCRPGCGACCIAPSITTPLPGAPGGKPAGVRCPHLSGDLRCELFGREERPAVCASLRPSPEMCRTGPREALRFLARLEARTRPEAGAAGNPAPACPPRFQRGTVARAPGPGRSLPGPGEPAAMQLTRDGVVQRSQGVVTASVQQELVLMTVERGEYFGLAGVAARIWERVEHPVPVGVLCQELGRLYDVEPGQCEREVLAFLEEAREQGLVSVLR